MSEFKVEVVRVGKIERHPNADRLGITLVHGGYPVIINISDPEALKEGDLAVYVPVDALVPLNRREFSFLRTDEGKDTHRIKAKRLRGVFSMGLLVPAPGGAHEGDDVQSAWGIEKYEPDGVKREIQAGGAGESEPDQDFMPIYTDLEGLRKWSKVLEEGEEVVITEKIHGQNARYVYHGGRLWVGSHKKVKRRPHKVTPIELETYKQDAYVWHLKHYVWRFLQWIKHIMALIGLNVQLPQEPSHPKMPRDVPSTNWWTVASQYELEKRLAYMPDLLIFGEIYGAVQDLKYGSPHQLRFRAFDAMEITTNTYLDYDDFEYMMEHLNIEIAPVLYQGPWHNGLRALAEGQTTLDGEHVREGIVIRPVRERVHPRLGRVILKLIGEGYLLR